MARLSLSLLGSFEARLAAGHPLGLPTKKAQALLAYLALPLGQAHPREKLAALLWGDTGDEQARNSLRHTLVVLRKTLPRTRPPALLVEGPTLALNPAAVDVDVAAFERRVAEGTPTALEHAAALYRGDLLDGFALREAPFEDWLLAERERLRELALAALGRLLAHQSQAGATERAIRTAARLLTLDPLQEEVHRTLMHLYARQGRRGAALRQYQVCAGVLQRELGTEPEADTKRLYQDLLQRRSAESPPPARARPTRSGRGTAARLAPALLPEETPLVGREPELLSLRRALDEAAQGRGQVVMLVGEAGIGKSRALAALAVEADRRGGRVLLGRAYETEQVLAFGPWVDALRGVDVAADAMVLDSLDPVWRAELARLLPELGGTEPEPSAPAADHRRLFEAIGRLVAALATDRPLLLLLEDGHWADEMSLRLLAFLGRRIRTARVLIGVTAREEELASAPVLDRVLDELGREPHAIRLTLARLSESDTAALVRGLARVGGGAEAVRRLATQVWALSEGNPFMVVETMRALQEGTAPPDSAELPLPDRVRRVIGSRLARLGERSRLLAGVAAVIEREFDFALLERAAGLGDREAAEGVEELVRRRVLEDVGERLAFTHDRIREVAYLDILPARRKVLHGRVATALEELYAQNLGPHYTALGRHSYESEAWDRAVRYLRLAGEQALARSAHREAAANLEQAMAALAHLPESPARLGEALDLRLLLRTALFVLTEFERMYAHLSQAKVEAEALGDERRLMRVLANSGTYFWLIGQHRKAIEVGERARALARSLALPGFEADADDRLMWAWHSLGEYRRAIDLGRQSIDLISSDPAYQPTLSGGPPVFARAWLAWCLTDLGDFADALARSDEGLRIAEVLDRPWGVIAACFGVGITRLRKGELPEAVSALERGLRLCEPSEIPIFMALVAPALGATYALLGRVAEAYPLLERSIEEMASVRLIANQALCVSWLGEACLAGGRVDAASTQAARALDLARTHEERGNEAYALRLLGDIAAQRDPPAREAAESRYREALALAEALGMRPLVAHCHLGLGRLHARAGEPPEAEAHLRLATTMYREMEMGFWLAQVRAASAPATVET
jgi:DNA-binding SARP family transcriptional activator